MGFAGRQELWDAAAQRRRWPGAHVVAATRLASGARRREPEGRQSLAAPEAHGVVGCHRVAAAGVAVATAAPTIAATRAVAGDHGVTEAQSVGGTHGAGGTHKGAGGSPEPIGSAKHAETPRPMRSSKLL